MITISKLKFVEVCWVDAHSVATWVDDVEDYPEPVACVSRGYVVKETNTFLVLAATVSLNKNGEIRGFGEVIAIPKGGFVTKVRRLKV